MSDLIERLRSPIIGIPNAVSLCIEAADEIERLTVKVERLETAARYACAEWSICWDRAIVTIDCNRAHRDLAQALAALQE